LSFEGLRYGSFALRHSIEVGSNDLSRCFRILSNPAPIAGGAPTR
jgi:hypothetical protein